MRIKFLGLIVLSFLFCHNLFADQNNDNADKKIPFAVYEQAPPVFQFSPNSLYSSSQPGFSAQTLKPKEIDTSALSKLIKNVRETVCPVAGDGDVRMWVSADVNAKLYILGAGAQSGFEVTLHCNGK